MTDTATRGLPVRRLFAHLSIASFLVANMAMEVSAGPLIAIFGEVVPGLIAVIMVLMSRRLVNARFVLWFLLLLAVSLSVAFFVQVTITSELEALMRGGVSVIAVSQCMWNRGQIETVLRWLSLVGTYTALQLLTSSRGLYLPTDLRYAWEMRQGDQFLGGNVNITAMNLVFAFAAAQYIAWLRRRSSGTRFWTAIGWLGSSVILAGVLTTGSRKALLACAVFVFIGALRKRAVLAVGVILAAFGVYEITQRVPQLYVVIGHRFAEESYTAASDQSRVDVAAEALDAFATHPFGVGFGSSGEWLSGLAYTHSNYLEVLVSAGLLGLVAYYWLPVLILFRTSYSQAPLAAFAFAVTVAGLFLEITQVTYLYRIPVFMMALCSAAVPEHSAPLGQRAKPKLSHSHG